MNIRPYQVDAVELLLSALDGTAPATRLELDDPGLGKTVIAAEAYNLLPARVAVVVCPAGLRQQWKRHLERHCGRFVYAAKSTAHTQRDAQLILDTLGKTLRTGPAPALVISHENMTACASPGSPFMRLLERGVACGRAGMQTPAMFALNAHVFGTHERVGIGLDAAVQALVGQLDPPDNPQHFSAPLACNILGVRP